MNPSDLYDSWKAGKTEEQRKAFKEILDKHNIEFSRYKQDCRKRALETAVELNKIGSPTEKSITDAADKYYNWLISIPNN